jgi:hypothetical protein
MMIMVHVLYMNNIHGSYSAGFIYYICIIQGLLAAHWPHVANPRRPEWQTFLRFCLDFSHYWKQRVFVPSFLMPDCNETDSRVQCDTVADFSVTWLGP